MFNKILVVCIGNICRSPTAEFLLKRELPNKHVASAGLYAMQGHDMNDQARTIAQENGVPCPEHSARQFTSELAKQYDLILVMEKRHRDDIAKRFPEALAKTMLLGHWDGGKDIPDPYKKSDEVFKQIFKMLETSALSWSKKLV